jgi:hypothetical protein
MLVLKSLESDFGNRFPAQGLRRFSISCWKWPCGPGITDVVVKDVDQGAGSAILDQRLLVRNWVRNTEMLGGRCAAGRE